MTATSEVDTASFRLPHDVIPKRYELSLTPDIPNRSFTGEQSVAVEVRQPVRQIVLNAIELDIHTAEISAGNAGPIAATVTLDEETERATLAFPQEIPPGDWTLHLTFTGTLNDKLRGFYRSTYRNADGEQKAIATTQFESTDARRAFPCWDEPAFKAVFSITILVEPGMTAISNSSVQNESTDQATGKRRVQFNDTMLLSTYLVAFIVGEFESTEPVDVAGTPVRVWATPGKQQLAGYALAAGSHAVSFFNGYYGIRYPGDKLDLIAIPDFAAGAMENLGASTFRENLLLLNPETSTHGELERVVEVEAHEIAHMWFGDLVTMRWWNGLWLKEAFATFMAMLAEDDYKPEWEVWTAFGLSRAGAMLVDGLNTTRSIEYTVVKPEDAAGMYDVLTYEKGAAVLRMLEQYLGSETFRRGINLYLVKHSYGNAETSDLWDALEEASNEPVRMVADSWIFQPGYPLVSADYRDGALTLAQQRFLYHPEGETSGQLWQVPVAIRIEHHGESATEKVLLGDREQRVEIPSGFRSITVNAGGNGVFRVRYSSDLLSKLTADLRSSLSPIERFNLVGDSWANVLAGYTPLSEFLDLTALFRDEDDVNVWAIILGGFSQARRIVDDANLPSLQALVRDRLQPMYQKLGWDPKESESDLTKQLRGQIVGALATHGNDPEVQQKLRDHYARYKEDPTSVDANVVAACIGSVAYTGGPEEYADFWQRFKNAPTPQEERRFLFSLAEFRDPALLQQSLDRAFAGEVRTQDAPFLISLTFYNRAGGELTWRFVTQHWDELLQTFPDNTIMRMVEGITALTRPEQAKETQAFFADHKVPDAGKRLDQALERQQIGVAFRERESSRLVEYLRSDDLGFVVH